MLAEARAPEQLLLPPPVGDLALARLFEPVPPARPSGHGQRRPRLAFQLYLIPPPIKPPIRGVVRTLEEALDEYREKEQKARKRRRKLAAAGQTAPAPPPQKKARQARKHTAVERAPVVAAVVHVPTAPIELAEAPAVEVLPGCDLAAWDWSEEANAARLVDGGGGIEAWVAWRGSVVEAAMARRTAAVQAELRAKGAPTGPKQVRTKQQAQAAATAVLMAGKPGVGKTKKAAPAGVAEGAKT